VHCTEFKLNGSVQHGAKTAAEKKTAATAAGLSAHWYEERKAEYFI